jgi:hypothetical protein
MAINLSDNIHVSSPKPVESKYLNITVPYTSCSEVNSCILSGERYPGLTVNINNVDYWYCGGILDSCLVQKTMGGSGTLTGATNGLSLVNSGTTVSLGGNLTGDTTINGTGLWDVNLSNVNGFNVSTSGSTTEIILEPAGITLSYSGTTVSLDSNNGLVYTGVNIENFVDNSLVNKKYVDTIAIGLQPKSAVWVATTGETITLSGSPKTIDGILVTNGQRILIKNQSGTTAAVDNGIYVVTGGTWQRSPDFDGSPQGEITQGALIPVLSGVTNFNTLWVLITEDPITGGTTPLSFTPFSTPGNYVGGTGIDVSVGTISLNAATQATLAAAITGITNSGSGESVYSGTSGHNIILNTIIGSGNTTVQKIGEEIVIFTSGGSEIYDLASPSICATGGMCIGTVLTGKSAIQILQEILVPELCGTLTPPSFSTTLVASTTYYEIGCMIPSLSVCGTFNRGCIDPQYMSTSDKRVGYATCYVYTGAQVAGTYICSACTISQSVTNYVLSGTPETWGITVCYGAGVQPLGQNGTPFNSACLAGSLSDSKTICGVYPIFATTSAIGTLTKQSYVAMTTTPVQLVLVAESGGLKDRFEIPNSWTGNPLKCICTYNTFSSAWEFEGGSGAASLTTWTPSVSSETLCCGSAPYCLYTYNGACRLTTTCIRLVF